MTPTDFRAWRRRLGMTQAQAAAATGLALRTVKAYEAGRPPKLPEVVARLCAYIEADPARHPEKQQRASTGARS